ncbi:Hypothetical_protein [Hexamita inflata]|uniref:Hypothetical_protein n=1 Tax=Hexamita inflata TaxID=28002 RepID=A0ABP1JIN1_9EUKA
MQQPLIRQVNQYVITHRGVWDAKTIARGLRCSLSSVYRCLGELTVNTFGYTKVPVTFRLYVVREMYFRGVDHIPVNQVRVPAQVGDAVHRLRQDAPPVERHAIPIVQIDHVNAMVPFNFDEMVENNDGSDEDEIVFRG